MAKRKSAKLDKSLKKITGIAKSLSKVIKKKKKKSKTPLLDTKIKENALDTLKHINKTVLRKTKKKKK